MTSESPTACQRSAHLLLPSRALEVIYLPILKLHIDIMYCLDAVPTYQAAFFSFCFVVMLCACNSRRGSQWKPAAP